MQNETNKTTGSGVALSLAYVLALAIAIATVGVGIYRLSKYGEWDLISAGGLGLIAVLITWPIAHSLSSRGPVQNTVGDALAPMYERLEQFSVMLNVISEQQLLSDRAKLVAYREKDREALRRAIQEDISRRDWEGALVLVNEMDNSFGYKQEAERIREEINQKFAEHIRRQVSAGVELIDRHTSNQQWAAAFREAERLEQQFPTLEEVRKLPNEIEQRRQAFKQRLLDEYQEKINARDTDGAINVVKRLDFYLSPDEATTIQESVRNVFKDKINQLRDQLANAIHQSRWQDAHRIADEVVRDFPNTQLAKECRDKLDSLRRRAQDGTAAAGV